MMFKIILILCFIQLYSSKFLLRDDTPVVQTKYGAIQGYAEFSSFVYLGIPYASPPVNELRWKNPIDAKSWSPNILNASIFQPACPQQHTCDPPGICPPSYGEDCLYLNVYVPKTVKTGEKKAVMVFIHGGNFQHYGASSPLFNSTFFASIGDVIVVTINYRLGALGFLVTGLEPDQIQGNFGIMDQKLAIKWVHQNIQAFGGDNDKITIFGQSAGAQSVAIHMMSADMQPYFRNGIIMSVPVSIPFRNFEDLMAIYVYFSDFLNCPARDIGCLRNKSIDEIVDAQMRAEQEVSSFKLLQFYEPWVPWLDGKIIKGELLEIEKWIGNESFPLKPIILGSMTEECVNYIFAAWGKPVPTKEYIAVITAALKEYAPLLLTKYPPEKNTTDQRNLMSVFATRWVFSCSSRQFFETYITNSKSGENDNYMYVFDFPFDFPGWGNDTYCIGHTCHGGDMPYTFDIPDANFTDVGHQIAIQHIQYWSNFAKNQSPNSNETLSGDSLLYWPKYDTINRNNLRFKAPQNIIEAKYLEKECDFLDSIGYYH